MPSDRRDALVVTTNMSKPAIARAMNDAVRAVLPLMPCAPRGVAEPPARLKNGPAKDATEAFLHLHPEAASAARQIGIRMAIAGDLPPLIRHG
jgi:hypothetical protein